MKLRVAALTSALRTFGLGAVACVVFCSAAARAEIEKRVALVIGNSAYKSAIRLENPVTDAKAVAASLKRLGFEVVEGYDLGSSDLRHKLAEFSADLPDSKAALVYYAGHGVSVDDENFLIPVDLELKSPTDLDLNALSLSVVLKQMKREERVNVVILDACRDNPFAAELQRGARSRSAVAERGLSRVDSDLAKGTLIAFATDPRSTALDGKPGDNSPFTKALLRHIEDPGVSIDTVMNRVRTDVWEETKQKQMPWVNTSIIGEFVLNPTKPAAGAQVAALADPSAPASAPAVGTLSADRLAQENKMWDSAERGNTADDYLAYLAAYPNGVYAQMARSRVARLSAPATPGPTAAAPPDGQTKSLASVAALRAEVGTMQTEKALGLDLKARKQIQQRLKVMEFDPGEANGKFTERTRAAIVDWQKRHDIQTTGWLGPLQRDAILEESEAAWTRFVNAQPMTPTRALSTAPKAKPRVAPTVAAAQAKRRAAQRQQPRDYPVRQQTQAAQPNPLGAFIGGMAIGGALGALRR
jgi:uncharacterized caspase-like protein